ncbi:uncharacterized protein LOC116122461 [Pistacia vera]|uniref:uncharacterized protein LOC116122461 n=1 Tax=Pistacia vera TaxID=55513 RepID=UPI00126356F1|nr:uncharacterized protein LOC116122461 [Pistacia vera]
MPNTKGSHQIFKYCSKQNNKEMKSIFAFLIFFSLLLIGCSPSYARKEPGEYWKSLMKEQPMPKAIKDLLHQDSEARKIDHFAKDFDVNPNVIIYHSHSEPKEGKPEEKSLVTHNNSKKG